MKKAAMFGLDARIALAIFGALSVISGAALYSAISNAKATSFVSNANELGKAWEQYYLDTGTSLPLNGSTIDTEDYHITLIENLVNDNGVKGWNGPYLSYSVRESFSLTTSDYYRIMLHYATSDETWGDTTTWQSAGFCTAGKKCYIWALFNGIEDDSLAKVIDKQVDGGDGSSAGNFRWWYNSSSTQKYRYHLKLLAVPNPHD
tara:strand:- start:2988 stop:3599 length:612 start_codon:yes stop_codon:yes gene_type:complete